MTINEVKRRQSNLVIATIFAVVFGLLALYVVNQTSYSTLVTHEASCTSIYAGDPVDAENCVSAAESKNASISNWGGWVEIIAIICVAGWIATYAKYLASKNTYRKTLRQNNEN